MTDTIELLSMLNSEDHLDIKLGIAICNELSSEERKQIKGLLIGEDEFNFGSGYYRSKNGKWAMSLQVPGAVYYTDIKGSSEYFNYENGGDRYIK